MPVEQIFPLLIDQLKLDIIPQSLQYVIALSPVLLAFTLFVIMWDVWVKYVRAKNFLSIKYTVLELRLPKDTWKSPLAMEVFLNSLHNTSDGSAYAKYWKGETRPWYSLEIVSIEGQVKFYIWTEDRRKGGVMSALYSQFPEIEIYEHEDYTRGVHYDPKTMKIWADEFKFTKEDPYPIKTYVDYGLDKDPKEEYKIDPLTPMIEFLGNIGPNQQMWIQMIIQAHIKGDRKPGHLWKKTDAWKDGAAKIVNELMLRDPKTKVAGKPAGEDKPVNAPTLSKIEQEIITAVERSVTKFAFDVGIRAIYLTKKDSFNGPFGIGGVIGNMKHFSSEHLNGFKPGGKLVAKIDSDWQDYKGIRKLRAAKKALKVYKRRAYFYPPYKGKPMVMNSEELATLYHFPGSVAATPSLERIPSKKSGAPLNLPV